MIDNNFAKNGFASYPAIFSEPECDQILTTLPAQMRAGRAGARHLMQQPAINNLAHDSRLIKLASALLSDNAQPYRATLFEKTGKANWLVVWHQDTALPLQQRNDQADWGPWSRKESLLYAHAPTWALSQIVALRIHLDDSTAENGPLRVIAGSHQFGVLSDEQVFNYAHKQQATSCLIARGGVLAISPLIIHSSSKSINDKPRRVLHIEYARTLTLKPDITLAIA